MRRTRTSGIFADAEGNKAVDKHYRGRRIRRVLGPVTQEEAEQWLARQLDEQRQAIDYGARPRRNFADAAGRFLDAHAERPWIMDAAHHIETLLPYIGKLELTQIHDGTLAPYIAARRKTESKHGRPISDTTIKRALEVARRILNLAARSWRHENGMTWLETAPLITMPDVRLTARKPRPLAWAEQRRLFARLPDAYATMALFAVNTGCREQEVVQMQWAWEVPVPELGTSVFVVPADFGGRSGRTGVKNREDRVVVLNSIARTVVDAQRGKHRTHVFTGERGEPVKFLNNTSWQQARKAVGLDVRVHDLKHTFARRLRAAGVSAETRKALLGHTNGDITTHYSAAELEELLTAVELVCGSNEGTLLRAVSGGRNTTDLPRAFAGKKTA